jgi:hypothetical protein
MKTSNRVPAQQDPRAFDRVRNHTAAHVNEAIDRKTGAHVRELAGRGREAVAARLAKLDREWDIERLIAVEAAVVATVLGELNRRRTSRFRMLLGAHQAMVMLHAATGWSPTTALLRRLGIRTRTEIDAERASLQNLLRFVDQDAQNEGQWRPPIGGVMASGG